MSKRIIGLDIGDVRIGVAVSDSSRMIATPCDTVTRLGWGPDVRKILDICGRYETDELVSGLPYNMDGTEGFQADKVRKFCEQLQAAGLTVFFQDERLTTVTAEDALLEGNVSREQRKKMVDKIAASLILQQWLDNQHQEENRMIDPKNGNMDPGEENLQEDFESEDELIELIDEEGKSTFFEHLATLEYKNQSYLFLCDPESQEDSTEVIVLLIEQDDQGQDIYVQPDDDLAEEVFEYFLTQIDTDPEEG